MSGALQGVDERPRRGIVRVCYSPRERFRRVVLEPGQEKSFGRDERADVSILDESLRGEHFHVFFDGVGFVVREKGAGKLFLDGRPAGFGNLRSGGVVAAGQTTLRVFLERRTALPELTTISPRAELAFARLAPARAARQLYGVFDSARDPLVRVLLDEAVDEHASLYEGADGAVLDDVAPYLVRFAPDSRLLERILAEGWGQAWGIFAVSAMNPRDVRRHFRRLLMVQDDETNERLYFRFYDPRVLRDFHGVATPRQREELASGLEQLIVESTDGAPAQLAGPTATPPGET